MAIKKKDIKLKQLFWMTGISHSFPAIVTVSTQRHFRLKSLENFKESVRLDKRDRLMLSTIRICTAEEAALYIEGRASELKGNIIKAKKDLLNYKKGIANLLS